MSRRLRSLGLNLFDFSDPHELLQAYVAKRREGPGSWNVSVWARHLGLKSSSSLFMAIHGKRRIGGFLEAKLNEYLGLNARESDYFKALVRAEASRRDPVLEDLARKRLTEIREGDPAERDILRFRRTRTLSLMGSVDTQRAGKLLEGTRLEPFPLLGSATLFVFVTHYGDSDFGEFTESSFGLMVRKKGSLVGGMGLSFFCGVLPRDDVRAYERDRWKIPYQPGSIELRAMSSGEAEVNVGLGGSHLFWLKMGSRRMAPAADVEQGPILCYTETLQDRAPYVLEMTSREYRRKFDPAIDGFAVQESDPRAELLRELEFCPVGWVYNDDSHGRLYAPNS